MHIPRQTCRTPTSRIALVLRRTDGRSTVSSSMSDALMLQPRQYCPAGRGSHLRDLAMQKLFASSLGFNTATSCL